VARGDALLDPAVTPSVMGQFAALPTPRDDLKAQVDELTAREREVLSLMASGLSNAEIAGELVLSQGTVKTHVRHVLHKLGLRDRIHAVIHRVRVGTAPTGRRTGYTEHRTPPVTSRAVTASALRARAGVSDDLRRTPAWDEGRVSG
jgi:DNA-binding CsgD family transcriptional regulator